MSKRDELLTDRQTELYNALKDGVRVTWSDKGGYWWRRDTLAHCTFAARELIRLGVVEIRRNVFDVVALDELVIKDEQKGGEI